MLFPVKKYVCLWKKEDFHWNAELRKINIIFINFPISILKASKCVDWRIFRLVSWELSDRPFLNFEALKSEVPELHQIVDFPILRL